MLLWLVMAFFGLPLIGMFFLVSRRGSMLSALTSKSGGATIGMLESLGLDPAKAVRLEFVLFFPTAEQATAAAADFPAPQWSAAVATEAADDGWACTATTESVVNQAILDALVTLCREVASAHGGDFDGWQVQTTDPTSFS